MTTKLLDTTLHRRFAEFNIPLETSKNIIPTDDSTLFVCAGMQLLKHRFENPDGTNHGNIQYCIRTNDIDEVGDGVHLTFFQMIGSFGFGTDNYEQHAEMWNAIMIDLGIRIDSVHTHFGAPHHSTIWKKLGRNVVDDNSCVWSDGKVGGFCSEMFHGNLEVGNLVNPLGQSVDVGFGYERIYQILCGKSRVDETDLFIQELDPVSRDHYRTLNVFHEQGITPGNKGRNYVCRRLLRRFIRLNPGVGLPAFLTRSAGSLKAEYADFDEWIEPEKSRMEKALKEGRKYYQKNPDKPEAFWLDTFGILPEELELLK